MKRRRWPKSKKWARRRRFKILWGGLGRRMLRVARERQNRKLTSIAISLLEEADVR